MKIPREKAKLGLKIPVTKNLSPSKLAFIKTGPLRKKEYIWIPREMLDIIAHDAAEEAYRKAAVSTLRKLRDLDEMPLKKFIESVQKYAEYLAKEYDITPKDLGK